MAKMKHLNQALLLMDAVVNEYWAVDKFTDSRSLVEDVPHAREPAEQIDVVQQSPTEAGGGLTVVQGDMVHDPGQIL
jgi:hypothetical protein